MAYTDAVLVDSPLGYWRLAETTGTVATDTSGNSRNGTYVATPTLGVTSFAAGGTGISLNGTTQYVDFGNLTAWQLTTGTYEVWFKRNGSLAGYTRLLLKVNAFSILLQDNVFGTYDWGASLWWGSGITPSDGVWHHAVMTFDSGVTNGTKVYLDGTLVLTATVTVFSQTTDGLLAGGGAIQPFNGSVDEPAIYGTILSQARVSAHYEAGSMPPPKYQPFVPMAVSVRA